jgi:transcriptional regulator with XRE-family HTH domain
MTDHPLRRWRHAQKITLTALADRMNVTASHLSEIETGKNVPSLKLAARLSEATADAEGVPLVQLTELVPQSVAAE